MSRGKVGYFRDSETGEYLRVDMRKLGGRRLSLAGAIYRALVLNPKTTDSSIDLVSLTYLRTLCEPRKRQDLPLALQQLLS